MKIADTSIVLTSSNVYEQQLKSTNITISGSLAPYQARALVYKATGGSIADFDIKTVSRQDNRQKQSAAGRLMESRAPGRAQDPYSQLREYKQELFKSIIQLLRGNRTNSLNNNSGGTQRGPNLVTTITITQIELYEKESFVFEASGAVKTSDDRTIDISVLLSMSREVYAKIDSASIAQTIQLTDPLVINFNTDSAGLSDMKFSFDLDADGTASQISALKSGSGFLAIDTYGDGSIRDGNQLFGTKSGNGFADLAQYDATSDGWIDENDPIFDKLRVWAKDEYGNDTLFALGELGIGAIFVGSVETNYSLYDTDIINGMISRTGIFLREDGTAGTIQHVDMRA